MYYAKIIMVLWAVMGFDSGMGMLDIPIMKALGGDFRFWYWYNWAYGKTMHWSAFVIYGLMFIGISRYLSSIDINGSKNTVYSFCFMFFNISLFEYFWIEGFAYWQNQPWVALWRWPQIRILIQNFGFVVVGVFGWIYLWADSHIFDEDGMVLGRYYMFKPDWKLVAIIVVTFASFWVWVNYPFPVEQFTVDIVGFGEWTNSLKFPQTLYTLDLNITDNINAGSWFYVRDPLIHFINTLSKALLAFTGFYYITRWKPCEN